MDAKDLEKSLMNDMPIFHGEDDINAVITWAKLAERIGMTLSSPRETKMLLLSGKLQGDASTWFDNYLRQHKEGEDNLSDMVTNFREYYLPSDFEDSLMKELLSLKQISSVRSYNRQFDRIVNHLVNVNEQQLLRSYIRGLKSEIRIVVAATAPLTWIEAQTTADRLDRINYGTSLAVKKFVKI